MSVVHSHSASGCSEVVAVKKVNGLVEYQDQDGRVLWTNESYTYVGTPIRYITVDDEPPVRKKATKAPRKRITKDDFRELVRIKKAA